MFTSCNKLELKKPDGTVRSTYQANIAAVMGQMSTGGGCNNLEELLCTIGIPSMSKPTFIEIERLLGSAFEIYLGELMLQAGQEEKELAIQNNEYHQNMPAITVIVDGGWSKRSHKHSYNANSGVGVIFGAATKKLLYMGIKNKYCAVCSIAQKKHSEPPNHKCFKNWTGSSTSMEADIIATGFRLSESMHGVRYTQVIGDGDSSVLYTIQTTVQSYGRDVVKIECANHAVKCYRSRLEQLAKDFPSFRGRGGLTKSVIMKITHGARCAIHNHSTSNDITKPRNDLRAGPKHYLGNHEACDPSWCSESTKEKPVNVNLHDLPPNLLFEIERAGDRLVNKAAQLISNRTTNLSECFMSIRAKMDGGKQINRIQSGSFEHRCMAAGLSMTLGPGWIEDTLKYLFGSCSSVTETFSNRRKRKHERDMERKSSDVYKKARIEKRYHLAPAATDNDYGPEAITPTNTTQEELQHICNEYLQSLQVTMEQASKLTRATMNQDPSLNSLWQQLRRLRLTASVFGTVIKRRKNFEKLVETILYKPPPGTVPALEWGQSHEDIAQQWYMNHKTTQFGSSYKVSKTGIHISTVDPWLAASPDSVVEDPTQAEGRRNGILEIKCPYSGRTMTPEVACQEINRFCSSLNNGQVTLKATHNYYYQVQGQLAITKLPWCDFLIWTPYGTSLQRIERDENLWKVMYSKLKSFYHEYLLPELADPVFYSGQSIQCLQLPLEFP